ncbi:hypothetical protein [Kordiimonas lacus]|uniref:Uncharacterized protein n=1 Tax=Kordiimonas lacus TaxID=637679 RepID=A0A1G7E7E0_9PROT|nr:hypothetical protein [Kordiimonas lacus]SDE59587.1 hypothetical protein SAMN04488071_3319 [Kordiimonas lacus]
MSAIIFGLALGLNATSPAIASEMNPHMLAADRHYQELVYQHRPLIRAAVIDTQGLALRQRPHAAKRAETDPVREVR